MSDDNTPTNQNQQNAPDWRDSELEKVRQEAASRRINLRNAEEKVATHEATIQTLTTEKGTESERANKAELALLKLQTALGAGIPGDKATDFAELLSGTTKEELEANAAKLQGLTGNGRRPAYDPSAGRGNGFSQGGNNGVPTTPEQDFIRQWTSLPMFNS